MKQIVRITLIALLVTAGYIGTKTALPTPQSGVVYAYGTNPMPTCPPRTVCSVSTQHR
jgi:hypothetical protein